MSTTNQNQQQEQLGESAAGNLDSIEEEIETSSQYFKPKPGKTLYHNIRSSKRQGSSGRKRQVQGCNGNPIKRYECKITHVNSGREQKWTVSKTVCLQIIEQLRNRTIILLTFWRYVLGMMLT